MSRRMRVASLLIIVLAVATMAAQSGPPSDAEVAARIQRIENGLLPPVVIKGQHTPGMKLAERMAFHKVPGVSIAVINQGRIEWTRGYGLADVDAKRAVTPATRFQAASISKSVAAAGALHLVEAGKLDLDSDVNNYLKSWKVPDNQFTQKQKVTLRRILSHSAGITVHGFPGYAAGEPLPTLVQILNGEKPANTVAIRVDELPDSEWRYSGGGYTVMQQMLIDVTGQPFPEFMQETVLAKFGMERSAYSQPLRTDWRTQAATGYRSGGNALEGNYHTYPELAAAGLWTTPEDLARFAIGIEQAAAGKSNPVLSQSIALQMLIRQKADDGLGVFLDGSDATLRFSHGGANEGFRCNLVAYATAGQGAVVMTNSDSGGELINEILFGIAQEYGWADYKPKERSMAHVDPKVFAGYVGSYQLMPNFKIKITREGDHLYEQAGSQPKAEIFPESVKDYFMKLEDAEFTFATDSQGRATELVVHQGGRDLHAKRVE